MKNYEAIKKIVESMEADVVKFNGGVNAAGARVRKGAQELKKAAQELRLEVQKTKEKRNK